MTWESFFSLQFFAQFFSTKLTKPSPPIKEPSEISDQLAPFIHLYFWSHKRTKKLVGVGEPWPVRNMCSGRGNSIQRKLKTDWHPSFPNLMHWTLADLTEKSQNNYEKMVLNGSFGLMKKTAQNALCLIVQKCRFGGKMPKKTLKNKLSHQLS